MQQNKIRVAVLFGGRSAEHEVSLQSAKNVIAALDPDRFEGVLIGIDRTGGWYLNDATLPLLTSDDPRQVALNQHGQRVALIASEYSGQLMVGEHMVTPIDVLFPVLHGPYGEDGAIQGLAKLANVACVGSDILGSAIGMDKDVAKRLLRDAGLGIADYICIRQHQITDALIDQVEQQLGYPAYVKPVNMGSSVGVSKVNSAAQLHQALIYAFEYDTKVMIEAAVIGRELECGVLGNDQVEVSKVAGEIVTDGQFYTYDRKYIDETGAKLQIPAAVDPSTLEKLRETAKAAYQCLQARGLGRVDMFLTDDGQIIVNEINTLPGFTAISMYPKLWQASGLSVTDLVTRLIELASEEHRAKQQLRSTEH